MAMNDSILELDVEEQLFNAVVHGTPEECQGLLQRVEDIDVKNGSLRSLLHVAVRLGKLKWVEALLEMGADLGIKDRNGFTVVQVAEEMNARLNEDEVRKYIMKLVHLVCKRESARKDNISGTEGGQSRSIKASSPRVEGLLHELAPIVFKLSRDMTSLQACVKDMSKEVATLNNAISQHLVSLCPGASSIGENVDSFPRDSLLMGESWPSARSEAEPLLRETPPAGRTLDHVRSDPVMSVSVDNNALVRQLVSMNEGMEELKSALTSRDILLERLEVSVTLLAEEWRPLKDSVNEVCSRVKDVVELKGVHADNPQESVCLNPQERIGLNTGISDRNSCIDSMMQKTIILNVNDKKASLVRNLYDKLYSTSPITASIMEFLQFYLQLRIMIDCDSTDIGKMNRRFTNIDGDVCEGKDNCTFTDLENTTVYLAGTNSFFERYVSVQFLARLLSRMSILLVFLNEGRPYAVGDGEHEQQYKRLVKEAIEEKAAGMDLDDGIKASLNRKTEKGREVDLISEVPTMIVCHGAIEGTLKLRQQLPELIDFFEDHVLRALSQRTQAMMAALRN